MPRGLRGEKAFDRRTRGWPREKDGENRERDGDMLYDRVRKGEKGEGVETTHRWQRIEKRAPPVRGERNERDGSETEEGEGVRKGWYNRCGHVQFPRG